MIATNYNGLVRTVFLSAFLFLAVACNDPAEAEGNSDYDKLCNIYKDIAQQAIGITEKEMKITERVQKDLPRFFETNFVHVIKADPGQRYRFIKQLAEAEIKNNWDCEVMRSYYANEFK